jgi:hypothetical protein
MLKTSSPFSKTIEVLPFAALGPLRETVFFGLARFPPSLYIF